MKRRWWMGAAALLLLTACTPQNAAPSDVQPASAAPAAEGTPAPTSASQPGLPYDEIRTAVRYDSTPARPCEGYFTMSQNGLWGLMRADGTELLPCQGSSPVSNCGAAGEWIWNAPVD